MSREANTPLQDLHAELEIALIDEFLRARGMDRRRLPELSPEEATRLMKEASAHATAQLSEFESRAHYVHEMHGTTTRPKKR
jgi:hypothetical protein